VIGSGKLSRIIGCFSNQRASLNQHLRKRYFSKTIKHYDQVGRSGFHIGFRSIAIDFGLPGKVGFGINE
jgi:hypothetical protein